MKRAMKLMCAAVLAAAASFSLMAEPGVRSYVQDGLIAQWDAIANAGIDAEGRDIHDGNQDTATWVEIVNGIAMGKRGSNDVNYGPNYVQFMGGVSLTNSIPGVKEALAAKSMTVEIFFHPSSVRQVYAGIFSIGGSTSCRELTLEQDDSGNTLNNGATAASHAGAFGRMQYAATAWAGTHKDWILLDYNTKQYFDKDVLVTIEVDADGAHLSIDNSETLLTNPGEGAAPKNGIVEVGGYYGNGMAAGSYIYAVRIYNRKLDATERAYNAALDQMRFLGKATDGLSMTIADSVGSAFSGAPCPDYGGFVATNGMECVFTNALSAIVTPTCFCSVTGYTHFAANGSVLAAGAGNSRTFTFDSATMGGSTFVWGLVASNRLDAAVNDANLGSVEGVPQETLLDSGETLAIQAVPAAGAGFIRWTGDLPDGAVDTDARLVLPMDRPRSVTAHFYDASQRPHYTELDWIESTGQEWIDTGLKVSGAMDVETYMLSLACGICQPSKTVDNATAYSLWGGGDETYTNVMMAVSACIYGTNAFVRSYYHGDGELLSGTVEETHKNQSSRFYGRKVDAIEEGLPTSPCLYRSVHRAGRVRMIVGDVELPARHTASNFVSTNNFLICKANTTGYESRPGQMKIWYFKIADSSSGALLRDFVPAKRDDTGEAGLLDRLTYTFYPNVSGAGAFIAGPASEKHWRATDDGAFNYGVEWTLSGYFGSSDLRNVPVLFRISESAVDGFHYSDCLANGADLAFSSKSDFSDRLPCEVDEWNAGGTSLVWVKVPALSGTGTKIYMRWGRETAAGNLPSTEVWADYIGAWHFSSIDPEIGAKDSGPRRLHAASSSSGGNPSVVDGMLGKAVTSPTSHYFVAPSHDHFVDTYDNMPVNFTAEIWFKGSKTTTAASGSRYTDIMVRNSNVTLYGVAVRYGWCWEYGSEKYTSAPFYYGKSGKSPANLHSLAGTTPDISANWVHFTAQSDGLRISRYENAKQSASIEYGTYIGGNDRTLAFDSNSRLDYLDEARLTREVLSPDRIAADYAMMTNAAFAVAGSVSQLHGYSLSIAATPSEYAAEAISHGYGAVDGVGRDDVVACGAPEFVYLNAGEDYRAFCTGWSLYMVDGGNETLVRTSGSTTVPGESATNAIVAVEGAMRLVWHWQEQYLVDVAAAEGGSTTGGGWCDAGLTVFLAAVPAEGSKFLCWGSGVPAADMLSPSISIPSLDSARSIAPVFVAEGYEPPDWLYVPGIGALADMNATNWIFVGVSRSGTRLSIPSSLDHVIPAAPTDLDFNGSIEDPQGQAYSLWRFTTSLWSNNLFGQTESAERSQVVQNLYLPESFTALASTSLGHFTLCENFEFRGDVSFINMRSFWKAARCKTIRFHGFPPDVDSDSTYTFVDCGAGNYRFRMEYPDYLENAWLHATNGHISAVSGVPTGARYDYKDRMSAKSKTNAYSEYKGAFGSAAAEPPGYASLNFKAGEGSPKRLCALVPYVESVKAGTVRLGVMGLPFRLSQTETLSPAYGRHEYAVGDAIAVTAPPQFTVADGKNYLCKGYVLTDTPSVTNRYRASFTIPSDTARNVGLTWIWKEHSGFRGMIITVK